MHENRQRKSTANDFLGTEAMEEIPIIWCNEFVTDSKQQSSALFHLHHIKCVNVLVSSYTTFYIFGRTINIFFFFSKTDKSNRKCFERKIHLCTCASTVLRDLQLKRGAWAN